MPDSDTTPQVGQFWMDNDPRLEGTRILRLVEVDDAPDGYVVAVNEDGRRSRIKKSRLKPTSTGYKLMR